MGNPTTALRSGPTQQALPTAPPGGRLRVRTTPGRIRVWTGVVVLLAATTAGALSMTVADTQRGVHTVGREAAPQAQITSDLYFALSDLDAQTARTLLTIGDDDLATAQLDAQLTFNTRLSDIDRDLRQAIAGANDPEAQRSLQQMMDGVARYHELASAAQWQDITSPDTKRGKAARTALAFYSQATDLVHFELLPTAGRLQDTYARQLTQATDDERSTVLRDQILSAVSGGALLVSLIGLQTLLRRRFHRRLNPYLAVASTATVALLATTLIMSAQQSDRLQNAVSDRMNPYLAIQHSRAVAYDATGAVVRYSVAPDFGYDKGYSEDANALREAGGKGLIAAGLQGSDPAVARTVDADWQAVAVDADRVMRAVDQNDLDTALTTATGIARGQLAMDFYAFDTHLGQAANAQLRRFDQALADARDGASGWAGLPAGVLAGVVVLALAGVRSRLNEYR